MKLKQLLTAAIFLHWKGIAVAGGAVTPTEVQRDICNRCNCCIQGQELTEAVKGTSAATLNNNYTIIQKDQFNGIAQDLAENHADRAKIEAAEEKSLRNLCERLPICSETNGKLSVDWDKLKSQPDTIGELEGMGFAAVPMFRQ